MTQAILGEPKNITVSQRCGKWYVSIQTEWETQTPTPEGGEVGIDMGVVRVATLSTGQYFEPIHAFKTLKGQLAKLQKQFKHKTKFSKNWQRLKAKIAKLHHRIANTRKNYLHQISHQISKKHVIVYVEDLQVANMSKSAQGTAEQHGKNVKQKSGLNRSILDQSWRILYSQTSFRAFVRLNYLRSSATKWVEFRRQLDYKLLWNGGYLIAVPPQNTSRCCPACGYTAKDNRQTQAVFECMDCGYTENADVVGAINVLKRGQAILAA